MEYNNFLTEVIVINVIPLALLAIIKIHVLHALKINIYLKMGYVFAKKVILKIQMVSVLKVTMIRLKKNVLNFALNKSILLIL